MQITFLRHGEVKFYHPDNPLLATNDPGLTESGKRQIGQWAEKNQYQKWGSMFVSDMARVTQSADIIEEYRFPKRQIKGWLREMEFNSDFERAPHEQVVRTVNHWKNLHPADKMFWAGMLGSETPHEHMHRVDKGIQTLVRQLRYKGQTDFPTLIVSHELTISAAIESLLGLLHRPYIFRIGFGQSLTVKHHDHRGWELTGS